MNSVLKALIIAGIASQFVACAKAPSSSENPHGLQMNPVMQATSGEDFVHRNADTNEVAPVPLSGPGASEKFTYFTGTPRKWTTTISWYYNPEGQPAMFDTAQVIERLIAATRQWEAVSGIKFQYQGQTSQAASFTTCDRNTIVGWGPLTNNTVGYTQACYNSTGFTEFDMKLDNRAGSFVSTLSYIQQVAVHEYGHALGLGHTDVTPAVMTAILSSLNLVQDDIDGVQSLYGLPTGTVVPTPTPSPTPAPTPVPTPTPTPRPAKWTVCAQENGYCGFSETRRVRFGVNGAFRTKTIRGGVKCSVSVFGDPAPGKLKHCEFSQPR